MPENLIRKISLYSAQNTLCIEAIEKHLNEIAVY